jgi:MSHA biogenesis protein MshO
MRYSKRKRATSQRGFSLLEMLMVLVLLSVAVFTVGQVIKVLFPPRAENASYERAAVLARTTVEQLTRFLQSAAPNTLRVGLGGACIEYLPAVAVTRYLEPLPTASNGVAATTTVRFGAPVTLDAAIKHVLVGSQAADEVYSSSSTASRATVATVSTEQVSLSATHTFLRASPAMRVFLAADPKRVCRVNTSLYLFESYGLNTGALTAQQGTGTSALMATGLRTSNTLFTITTAAGSNATVVEVELSLGSDADPKTLKRAVAIANAY